MSTCAFYHWWSHSGEPSPFANLRTPIIASIASLRAVSCMPIVVFDVSDSPNDWGHFPERLKFRVIRGECSLKKYKHIVEGWKHLSRVYDVQTLMFQYNIECDTVMYVDSDVFWLRDPQPLSKDTNKFVFDGFNSGFFYYNLYKHYSSPFFEIFDAYTRAAVYSKEVRDVIGKYVGYNSWYTVWDEMMLTYMKHEHPELFEICDVNEHMTVRKLAEADQSKVKMLHCNGLMVENPITGHKHSRGLASMLIKEFYNNLRKSLDQHEIDMMFSRAEQDYCLNKQFSLFDDMDRLLATRDEEGSYHTIRMI